MKFRKIKKYYKKGLKYLNQEDFKKSLSYYRKISDKFLPPYALMNKGVCYFENGLCTKAIKIIKKAIKINAEKYEIFFSLAQTFNGLGDYSSSKIANELLSKANYHKSMNAKFYYNLGLAYKKSNLYKKAILNFSKAIYYDLTYSEAFCSRGDCYINLKKYDKALLDLNRAIELDTNYLDAYVNRSALFIETTNFEKAIEDYDKAMRISCTAHRLFPDSKEVIFTCHIYL